MLDTAVSCESAVDACRRRGRRLVVIPSAVVYEQILTQSKLNVSNIRCRKEYRFRDDLNVISYHGNEV